MNKFYLFKKKVISRYPYTINIAIIPQLDDLICFYQFINFVQFALKLICICLGFFFQVFPPIQGLTSSFAKGFIKEPLLKKLSYELSEEFFPAFRTTQSSVIHISSHNVHLWRMEILFISTHVSHIRNSCPFLGSHIFIKVDTAL